MAMARVLGIRRMLSTMASPILPPDFLLGPAPNLTKNNVDFKKTELPEYHGLYATVLDGCLTKEECDLLVRAAEATAKGVWEPAMVNVGGGQQKMIRESRDCGRILWDDRDMVERIWNRVKPVMGEIMEVGQIPRVSGRYGFKSSQVWEMTRLNERMRFLKYGRGQYFRRKSNVKTKNFNVSMRLTKLLTSSLRRRLCNRE